MPTLTTSTEYSTEVLAEQSGKKKMKGTQIGKEEIIWSVYRPHDLMCRNPKKYTLFTTYNEVSKVEGYKTNKPKSVVSIY